MHGVGCLGQRWAGAPPPCLPLPPLHLLSPPPKILPLPPLYLLSPPPPPLPLPALPACPSRPVQVLSFDLQLVNVYPESSIRHVGLEGTIYRRVLQEASSWENPRAPFEVGRQGATGGRGEGRAAGAGLGLHMCKHVCGVCNKYDSGRCVTPLSIHPTNNAQ